MGGAGRARVLAIDTGGTMTDTFVVDAAGGFTIGKAQTTPHDEAEGLLRSFADALRSWELTPEEAATELGTVVYSGTAMLNRLLQRQGEGPIGVITSAGFEDVLRFGRGIQSYVGSPYAERLHARSHEHPEPIVPRQMVRGVRGRIHFTGVEIAGLSEDEARVAVRELLDAGARAICVCLLYSYRNPSHEERVGQIAAEVIAARGLDVPVYLSCRHNPVRGELPRLNSLIMEVYAAKPSRRQLQGIRNRLREAGSAAPFRVLTCYGGTVSPEHEWLVSTLVSGPIGGIIGSRHVADLLGVHNVVCTDVGGTSFDVGLITEKQYAIRTETALARFMLNLPMIAMDSIGAGTGTFVRLDPVIRRLNLGPDSAGYRVGVCNPAGEIDTVTITDCDVLLGYLNPDFFLGGEIRLEPDRAERAIAEQIARPLGVDPVEAAWGTVKLLETQMRDHLHAMVLGVGYSPENYHLLSYGGGGPLHVAGVCEGLRFEKVLVPSWAAAFSAFGCACADYSYRYDRSVDLVVTPDRAMHEMVSGALNAAWEELRARLADEFRRDGIDPAQMLFQPLVRMQYRGMLDDLEVPVNGLPLDPAGLDRVIGQYEQLFERIFARAARSPEAGFVVTKAIGIAVAPAEKPVVPRLPLGPARPDPMAAKPARDLYWDGRWHRAQIWDMDRLQPGNVVEGPAVIEAPATTFVVPPQRLARLDEYRIFHLEG